MNSTRFHAAMLAFYIILVPVAAYAGWLKSVTFVSALSLVALVEARLGSLVTARGFKQQNEA